MKQMKKCDRDCIKGMHYAANGEHWICPGCNGTGVMEIKMDQFQEEIEQVARICHFQPFIQWAANYISNKDRTSKSARRIVKEIRYEADRSFVHRREHLMQAWHVCRATYAQTKAAQKHELSFLENGDVSKSK